MSPDRKVAKGPSRKDLRRFDEASRRWDDYRNDKQFHIWAKAANVLNAKGYRPEQVIERLWKVRNIIPDAGMTPARAFQMAVAADAAEKARKARKARSIRPHVPDYDELMFHGSLIQTAVLTGEQVVVRGGREFTMSQLPHDIFPADYVKRIQAY
ncbi:hypothetical protein HYW43_03520 [Candidatus Daviesbacteria bacterium]|nr:hypothetical protein [Candidatus Daviesbacteria bacterium]